MPRKARIDAPGALHHIIVRGIERRKIFKDDTDRINFLGRPGKVLSETGTTCFAWALIPNHFHLLLRTGACPLSTVMRRLLAGHAMNFNRRHRQSGQLFQNRYKSILGGIRERSCRNCRNKTRSARMSRISDPVFAGRNVLSYFVARFREPA
jgi:REP element-mobilizing transposase RayT